MLAKVVLLLLCTSAVAGCATSVAPTVELDQARQMLAQARSGPNAGHARRKLEAAEAAVAYAEFEQRESPAHPLNSVRAHEALLRADEARAASQGTTATR